MVANALPYTWSRGASVMTYFLWRTQSGDIGLVPLVCDQIYIGLFHVECEQALKNYWGRSKWNLSKDPMTVGFVEISWRFLSRIFWTKFRLARCPISKTGRLSNLSLVTILNFMKQRRISYLCLLVCLSKIAHGSLVFVCACFDLNIEKFWDLKDKCICHGKFVFVLSFFKYQFSGRLFATNESICDFILKINNI